MIFLMKRQFANRQIMSINLVWGYWACIVFNLYLLRVTLIIS